MNATLSAWFCLALSILTEVFGMIFLNQSKGFTQAIPTILAFTCFIAAIWLISLAMKHIENGIAYAIWAGSSTAILAITGVIWQHESLSTLKVMGILLTIAGVVMLNLAEVH